LSCRPDCAEPKAYPEISKINPMKTNKRGPVLMKSTYNDKDKATIDFTVPEGLEYMIVQTTNDNQVTEFKQADLGTGAAQKFTLENQPNYPRHGWADITVKAFSQCGKFKTSAAAVVCDKAQHSTGLTTIKLRVRNDEELTFLWDKHA